MRKIIKAIMWSFLLVTILSGCMVEGQHDPQQVSDARHIAFIHVNVVPMTGEIIAKDQTVLIEGDQIIAVGPERSVSLPENATIIDGEGAYLMPGLADMHMHTRLDWESDDWPVSPLLLYLANGVTSPLGDPQGLVRENHKLGFDFLKLYSCLSPEDFQEALATAKELEMYSAGHVPYAVGLERALAEGMNEIAHVEELLPEFIEFNQDRQLSPEEWLPYLVRSAMQQFEIAAGFSEVDFNRQHGDTLAWIIEQLQSAGAPVCTTMVVDDVIQLKLFQTQTFLDRPENRYSPVGYLDLIRRGEEKHQLQFKGIEDLASFKYDIDRWILARLHQAGIPLLLGTDSGTGGMGSVPGFSVHDELRILTENGLSPYEAIATGTINAANAIERMTGKGDFGTIEVGQRADLILVQGNPLEDVSNIRNPLGVMAAGRWYSRETLAQMIEAPNPTNIARVPYTNKP
jgi:imidazolonepropionase-like amidohydrolase